MQECYKHVSEALGVIYRDLTLSSKHPFGRSPITPTPSLHLFICFSFLGCAGGKAFLSVDNTDEPYLGGVRFTAMPPMKRFRDMGQLSGGEKTIAALALLFSLHR